MATQNSTFLCALAAGAWLAIPMGVQAQSYSDPIVGSPLPEASSSQAQGGNQRDDNENQTPPSDPIGSSNTGHPTDALGPLTDATGQTATISLGNKALQFESSGRRSGSGLEYDAGLDSAQGGGSSGGFPFWEGNNDWFVIEPARCEVAGPGEMDKIAGTKLQTFSCYIEWMDGDKEYVDLAHCDASANNTKDSVGGERKSYMPSACPHPEWVFGEWSDWSYTSNWYAAPEESSKTCGTITEYRDKNRTRSLSCQHGSLNDCMTYNGPALTSETERDERSISLGSCTTWSSWERFILPITRNHECSIVEIKRSSPNKVRYVIQNINSITGMCFGQVSFRSDY